MICRWSSTSPLASRSCTWARSWSWRTVRISMPIRCIRTRKRCSPRCRWPIHRFTKREEIRTLILDAAREMFAAEGYDAVTMRRIAERIEYSPTAIYFHFKDKDALMHELCDTDFAKLAQEFGPIARIADPIERLHK